MIDCRCDLVAEGTIGGDRGSVANGVARMKGLCRSSTFSLASTWPREWAEYAGGYSVQQPAPSNWLTA
jgi:hypothetical protein